MYPFRNILFPTDFSPNAKAALKYAAAFARNADGHVVMFNVQGTRVPSDLLHSNVELGDQSLLQLRADAQAWGSDPLFENIEVEIAFEKRRARDERVLLGMRRAGDDPHANPR